MSGSCKNKFPRIAIERIILTEIKSADVFRSMSSYYGQVLYSNRFYCTTSACLAKRFLWHILSKQRLCSPYSGIPINTDVGNPTAPVATPPPSKAGSKRSRGRLLVFSLFIIGPRLVSFLQSSIESSPCSKFQHPEPQIRALRTFNNVQLQPSGPVDALLRHGGGRAKVERG